jgi:solute carrier family 25 oxoglutarate transporter 11
MKPDADGKFPYKNIFDCLKKTYTNEGLSGIWVGLPVYYTRVAPHAMIVINYINLFI